MAKKKLSELNVTGPAIAGVLVGIGAGLAIHPLAGPAAWLLTTAALVFARYKLQAD